MSESLKELAKNISLKDIGARIKRLRQELGLSQSAFLEILNAEADKTDGYRYAGGQANWSKIEKGERAFNPIITHHLCSVLNITPSQLLLPDEDTDKVILETSEEIDTFYTEVSLISINKEPPRRRSGARMVIKDPGRSADMLSMHRKENTLRTHPFDWQLISGIVHQISTKTDLSNTDVSDLADVLKKSYLFHLTRKEMQLESLDESSIHEFLKQSGIIES